MTSAELLVDAFDRIRELVHRVVDGLSPEQLAFRVDPEANSIAWLVWHLTRVQDDHLADAFEAEQVWSSQGWVERFGLPFDPRDTGYGHRADDVAAVQVGSGELLVGYHDAVHQQTTRQVKGLSDADLARIVDRSWDPPVSLGVRLVSVIADDLQHAGQAAFVRGILQRPRPTARRVAAAAPIAFPTAPVTARRPPMINGAHAILYSDDADATRAVLAKVLGTRSVDAGGGWLIFALPPAELAVHPAEEGGRAELYLLCDDVAATVTALQVEGVEIARPISDQGWGLLTAITLPGGVELGLYQPRHPTAAQLS